MQCWCCCELSAKHTAVLHNHLQICMRCGHQPPVLPRMLYVSGADGRIRTDLLQVPFFLGCIMYNFFPGHMGAAGAAVLRFLVYGGAVMQVTRLGQGPGKGWG